GGGVATQGLPQPGVRPLFPGLAAAPTDTARRALVEGMISQAGHPNITMLQPLVAGFQQEQQANAALARPARAQPSFARPSGVQPRQSTLFGRVTLAAGADRSGVRTSQAVLR